MGGVKETPEHHIRCNAPSDDSSGDEKLCFYIDEQPRSVNLKIGGLSELHVSRLPNLVMDLIEIATLVYAVDACISRGGTADQCMAAKWHRVFHIEIPVRELSTWQRNDIRSALEEMLMFLSGDRFHFTFTKNNTASSTSKYFKFGDDGDWKPDSVVMFSGGLDSLAGALEEIVERKNKVALISHHSSTKIAHVQKVLQKEIGKRQGTEMIKHIPITAQLGRASNKEGTHRTRSFLFAALGIANVIAFELDRLKFYENGFVSLNLPPVGNVLGTRATRTTHPQTLDRFSTLFSLLLNKNLRVENPYFWRTKKDVVEKIDQLNFGDLIKDTRSCADVHNLTNMHTHCGRCSQCVDRRFAIMGAKLERYDPAEAYRVDLMTGAHSSVTDKEIALSYVRAAQLFETATVQSLEGRYSVLSSVVAYLGGSHDETLLRIAQFLRRHGTGVMDVMRNALKDRRLDDLDSNSLPRLYGDIQQGKILGSVGAETNTATQVPEKKMLDLVFIERPAKLIIEGCVEIKGAGFRLLRLLADANLDGAGRGLAPEDYPLLKADKLSAALKMASAESLRKSINRTRKSLGKMFTSAGLDADMAEALIENNPWSGYRLNPDLVKVTLKKSP